MKTKVVQLAVLLVIGSFCTVCIAARPGETDVSLSP
jgi:hypothetical protein